MKSTWSKEGEPGDGVTGVEKHLVGGSEYERNGWK